MPALLLLSFGAIWLVLAINPLYRQDWLLENVIVAIAVPALVVAYRKMRLSNTSYVAISVWHISGPKEMCGMRIKI